MRPARYADDDDDLDRREERTGFRCPYCGSRSPPILKNKVSPGGWVLFVVCLLFVITILFCWVPLLFMKEDYRVCSSCGIKLG
jgi:predicted RNA-binding Zn-ribbon protein involved in translation (DUF1610 family)